MWWFSKRSGDSEPAPTASFRVEAGLATDAGCVRDINEDSGRLVWPDDPRRMEKRGILIAIADGMGGHEAGEQASRMAVDKITEEYYRRSDDPHASLAHAFEKANREVHEESRRTPAWEGMGTTCTALALRGESAYAAQVGDSRCYLVRGGGTYLMTEDHSMVMELVRQGTITLDEARSHSDRNLIMRSIGTKPKVEVALWVEPFPLRAGDRFVVCTDGLYDLVRDEEMESVVSVLPPQEASDELVRMARERGGHDNITVSVVAVHPPGGNSTPD